MQWMCCVQCDGYKIQRKKNKKAHLDRFGCVAGILTVVRRIKKLLSELWREKVDFAKSNRARRHLKWWCYNNTVKLHYFLACRHACLFARLLTASFLCKCHIFSFVTDKFHYFLSNTNLAQPIAISLRKVMPTKNEKFVIVAKFLLGLGMAFSRSMSLN